MKEIEGGLVAPKEVEAKGAIAKETVALERSPIEEKNVSEGKKHSTKTQKQLGEEKQASARLVQPESKSVYIKKKSQFSDYKLFNKWSFSDVVVTDLSIVRYVDLNPVVIPHSFGRKTRGRFEKANLNIVERLVNKIMRSGQGKRKLSGKFIRGRGSCGKKLEAVQIVEKAFAIIEKQTKQNPIQVFVKAVENAAPREDITRIKRGGVAYTIAVDVSPLKRLDEAIKNIALGAFGGSFNRKTSAEVALAEEIIAAANNDTKSSAIKRKDEVERIARASR